MSYFLILQHELTKFKMMEILVRAFIQNCNPKTVDIVLVTADKGLCGGFNVSNN